MSEKPKADYLDKLATFKEEKFGLSAEQKRRSNSLKSDWNEEGAQQGKDNGMNQTDSASQQVESRRELLQQKTTIVNTDRNALLEQIMNKNQAGGSDGSEQVQNTSADMIADSSAGAGSEELPQVIRQKEPSITTTVDKIVDDSRQVVAVNVLENCHKCKYLHPTTDHPDKDYFPCYKEEECPARAFVFMQEPVPEDKLDALIDQIRETGDLTGLAGVADELYEQFEGDISNFVFKAGLKQLAVAFCSALDIRVPNEQ